MPATDPHRTLDRTARLLLHVLTAWPAWNQAITDQLADGYPTGDSGPGSGVADPTFAAVARRDRLARAYAAIVADVERLAATAYSIERAMNHYGPRIDTTAQVRTHRCGVDPVCTQLGVRDVQRLNGTRVEACRLHYEAVGRGELEGFKRIKPIPDRGAA